MKTAFTALLVFLSISMAIGQTMCKSVRFADKAFIPGFDYPYNRFKTFESTGVIPDSIKQKIDQATIKETSRSFFKKLTVKKVFVFDSTVKNKMFDVARYKDEQGNQIEHVYSFLYELKLNDNIPFLFRVDYNKKGELMRKVQLESLDLKRQKVINCDEAIETALTDKTEPIHDIDQIFLGIDPLHKTVVYQITSIMDPATNMVYTKFISAYNGKVIARSNYKVEIEQLEEVRIGG
ncbi:hypothetical protein [Niastella sp. OAS944]|uniref:hypothetical protein n=1 Tax=Niastella sp. OAS944 TaxID=2664089 RepID=UPI0034957DE0|nr:hypothetical protein [Chitinophagaceae bacterium OAS944]